MPSVQEKETPELELIIKQLREIGNLYQDGLSRLNSIGNRLHDDSGAMEAGQKEPAIKNPGRISELNEIIIGYRTLFNGYERTINKIEKYI